MNIVANLRWMRRWETAVFAAALGMFVGHAIAAVEHWSASRDGFIVVTAEPADASVLIDNVKLEETSPVVIKQRSGPYTVSVTRDGYVRNDQTVEVVPGRATVLKVKLEVSRDTGYELTSEPPGQLVWLDGAPVMAGNGNQTRTDFRAAGIPPGHHVLEVRGDHIKPWRQDFIVEPGSLRRIHATLIPADPLRMRAAGGR